MPNSERKVLKQSRCHTLKLDEMANEQRQLMTVLLLYVLSSSFFVIAGLALDVGMDL